MDQLVAGVIGAIALVLVVSSIFGVVARRLRQPAVVGQILAGIVLGPSLLGRLPGHLTSHLFPRQVLPSLAAFAQIAVVIFMFTVGYELHWRSLQKGRLAAPLVAICSFLVPMGLGPVTVLVLRARFQALGQEHIDHSFLLFMGVAISITALPVLAAILRERGSVTTTAGITAATAAGLMDVSAWLALALALAAAQDLPGRRPWTATVLLLGCFLLVMLTAVRPLLRWWINQGRGILSDPLLVALVLALASAWVTATLGLHPVFGGFLAGIVMPRIADNPDFLHRLGAISDLLLPIFFVITGLTLNVGSMNATAFLVLAAVCLAASTGKLVPAYVASRLSGLDREQSATVAVLVNARGLTELIALNVALTAGLIGQRLFTVLVLMALIMTMVTAPLLALIGVVAAWRGAQREMAPPVREDERPLTTAPSIPVTELDIGARKHCWKRSS